MGTNKNNNKGFCLLTERTKTKRMSPLPREMMFDENAPEPLTKGNVDKALHVLRNRETINKDHMDDPSVVVGCRVRAIRNLDGVFEQGSAGAASDRHDERTAIHGHAATEPIRRHARHEVRQQHGGLRTAAKEEAKKKKQQEEKQNGSEPKPNWKLVMP